MGIEFQAADVEFLALDDEGFIYSAEMEMLVGLNRTATFIWRACTADRTLREVIALTADEFDLPLDTADTFVKLAVVEWENYGLLKDSYRGSNARLHLEDRPVDIQPPESPVFPAAETIFETRCYAVLDMTFTVTCQTAAQAERLHAVAGHLEIAVEAALSPITINILGEDGAQEIFANGRLSERCDTLSELAPLIHWLIFSSALLDDRFALQLHTAAVAREGHALLLSGPAGTGKSTLSAALLDEGFGYLSDDTVVLDRHSFHVRGLPFSICVKESGLALLDGVASKKTLLHLRTDGRRVHYRHPAPGSLIVEPQAACWVAFPRYTPDAAGEIREITSAEALRRLLDQSIAPRHLSRQTAVGLISWAAQLQCCELDFPDTRSAIDAIQKFCSQ